MPLADPPHPRFTVEHMHQGRFGRDVDGVAGSGVDALAKGTHDRQRAEASVHLGFGAGGFDDLDREWDAGAGVRQVEVFRTNAVDDRAPGCGKKLGPWRQGPQGAALGAEAVRLNGAGQEIHGWAADEPGDELVGGAVIQVERRAGLFNPSRVHHDDFVGHGHRLDLIMGDVDGRGAEALVQGLKLGPGLNPQFGVEVREWFVKEEDLGIADDGAAHGDPLPLSAGQLARISIQEGAEAEDRGGAVDPLLDGGAGSAGEIEAEGHVVADGHVRIEGVILEDHGDIALFGREFVDDPAADADDSAVDFLQPGDHAQERAFAAAGGADQDSELAIGDVDAYAMQDGCGAERFFDVLDRDGGHRIEPPLRGLFRLSVLIIAGGSQLAIPAPISPIVPVKLVAISNGCKLLFSLFGGVGGMRRFILRFWIANGLFGLKPGLCALTGGRCSA